MEYYNNCGAPVSRRPVRFGVKLRHSIRAVFESASE